MWRPRVVLAELGAFVALSMYRQYRDVLQLSRSQEMLLGVGLNRCRLNHSKPQNETKTNWCGVAQQKGAGTDNGTNVAATTEHVWPLPVALLSQSRVAPDNHRS
jgi:hypothetical protein